jgi:hypothetical protein
MTYRNRNHLIEKGKEFSEILDIRNAAMPQELREGAAPIGRATVAARGGVRLAPAKDSR